MLLIFALCVNCGVNCDDTSYSFLVFFRVRGSFVRIALP